MTDAAAHHQYSALETPRFYKVAAATLPALVLGYSALIDPLVNFNLAEGITHGRMVIISGEEKSTFLAKLLIPAFLVVALLLAYRLNPTLPRRLKTLAVPGALFLAFAFASFMWAKSPADTRTFAIYQILLCGTLFVAVAASGEPVRILRCLLLMFAVTVAANLVAVLLRPESLDGHAGIYNFKNTLGGAAGCALLFGVFHLFEGRLFWRAVAWFTTIGALVLTFASGAKTAIALVFFAPILATVFWGTGRLLSLGPLLTSLVLLALGVSGFMTVSLLADFNVDDVLKAVYGDTTFTGRTDIWAFMYDYIQQSPWYGNGYRGFWSLGLESPKHRSEDSFIRTIGGGHNGYMDILLDLGVIGLGLLMAFMLTMLGIINRFALRPARRSLCYLSMFIFLGTRNMMESGILWTPAFDSLSFVLVGLLACFYEPQDRSAPGTGTPYRTGRSPRAQPSVTPAQ
ncbi:MAG: O-antigen ligase family protein [Pseudomonadota bacterium]